MAKSSSGKKGLAKHKSKKELRCEGGTEMGYYGSDTSASYSKSKSGGTKSCHY